MVSRRPIFFISSYSNIILLIIYLFFIYFKAIVIKLSCALFLGVVEELQYTIGFLCRTYFFCRPGVRHTKSLQLILYLH